MRFHQPGSPWILGTLTSAAAKAAWTMQVSSLLLKGNMRSSLAKAEQEQGEMLQAELYSVAKAGEPLI